MWQPQGVPETPVEADIALVGGGGAASLLLAALDRHDVTAVKVAVVDPVRKAGQDRTWAFWDTPGDSALEPLLSAQWPQADIVTTEGRRTLDLQPLRYAMVRSGPVYELAAAAEKRLGAVRVTEAVGELEEDGTGVTVRGADGRELVRAGWVLDSRPRKPEKPGRTSWVQHFRGWWLEADAPVFDPERAVLMDFRTPQPERGVSFGYVLPVSATFALVEYTEFSPAVLDDAGYDAGLRAYAELLGLDLEKVTVREVEDGVIPMTDAPFEAQPSARVGRIGTAGGATRPSTGFTFSAMRRQAEEIALALKDGLPPLPQPAYPRRHLWMDAVALRAWDRGDVDPVDFFVRLFDRNPAERVLRFLDGSTTLAEDLAVMRSSPLLPMTGAVLGDAKDRLRRL